MGQIQELLEGMEWCSEGQNLKSSIFLHTETDTDALSVAALEILNLRTTLLKCKEGAQHGNGTDCTANCC